MAGKLKTAVVGIGKVTDLHSSSPGQSEGIRIYSSLQPK